VSAGLWLVAESNGKLLERNSGAARQDRLLPKNSPTGKDPRWEASPGFASIAVGNDMEFKQQNVSNGSYDVTLIEASGRFVGGI
jgi:hypothetical protein